MENFSFGIVVNPVYGWVQFRALLAPIETVRHVQAGIPGTRYRIGRAVGLTRSNSRGVIAVFHALKASLRVPHLEPLIRPRPAGRESTRAVGCGERINEICSRRIMELRLDPDLVRDGGQLTICVRKRGESARGERLRDFGDLERIARQLVGNSRNLAKRVGECGHAEARIIADAYCVTRGIDHLGKEEVRRIG